MTAGAPGSPWVNDGALENSKGAVAGKYQSDTPKRVDEGSCLKCWRAARSAVFAVPPQQCSLMVSWMMLRGP